MRARRAIAVVGLALALAGCGDDGGDDQVLQAPDTSAAEVVEATGTTPPPTTTATTATTTEPDVRTIEIAYADGEVEGGVRTESVEAGERVRLSVTADVVEEVHVHGYDLYVDLEPGVAATAELTADLPGVWEVELHGAGSPLLELEVAG